MSRFSMVAMAAVAGFVLAAAPVQAEPLTKAEPKYVCMVNDTLLFPKDQIPVEVGGKTYFGCCEMCKGRLATDEAVRHAKDPVSGKTVDKATAVIGAKPDGKVLYFESEKTFKAFHPKS